MSSLWVDDETDDRLGQFLPERVRRDGHDFEVVSARGRHIDDLVRDIASRDPSALFMDWQLGDEFDGIRLSQQILQSTNVTRIHFLSRFAKQEEVLRQIDPRAVREQVTKPDDLTQDGLERWYQEKFKSVVESVVDDPVGERKSAGKPPEYFTVDALEYRSLPIKHRRRLKVEAADAAVDELSDVFERSETPWLIVVGWPLVITRVGAPDQDPDRDLVSKIEHEWGLMPLVVHRPAVVNLFDTELGCALDYGRAGKSDWFPTIQFEFGGSVFDYHFDTGCPVSLLSYEFTRRKKACPEVLEEDWQAQPVKVGLASWKNLLVYAWRKHTATPADQGQAESILRYLLVDEFEQTDLKLHCAQNCELNGRDSDIPLGSCTLRQGLIGRDALLTAGWKLVISAPERRVYVLRDEAQPKRRRRYPFGG